MEDKLRKLFDYQKFAQNKNLQKQIDIVLCGEFEECICDDLLVAVAGGKDIDNNEKENNSLQD